MASASFDDSNWSNYHEITSDNTQVDEAVGDIMYDFADIPGTSGFWSTVKSDGGDIRITNSAGDTAYSFELENFDTTAETGVVFFDSQNLSTSSNVTWRIYYGNGSASMPAETDTLGEHNVWGNDYALSARMDDTSGSITDSTANGYDGTANGNIPDAVSGKVGDGQDFDGGDNTNYSDHGDQSEFDMAGTGDRTLSMWLNIDAYQAGGKFGFVAKNASAGDDWNYAGTIDDSGVIHWYSGSGGSVNDVAQSSSNAVPTDTWTHIVIGWDSSNSAVQIYVDGSADGSASGVSAGASAASLWLADSQNGFVGTDGTIDDVRFLTADKGANWVSTHYNIQNNPTGFWTTGAEQTVSAGATPRSFGTIL